MVSHWGADGSPDGMADKGFVVFGIGGILLGLHILLLFLFSLDKNARTQNKKAASIICWLVPWISAFVAATVYPLAMGENPDPLRLLPGLVSVMFICLGNVMPKVTKNRTMGIKLSWTLGNEENWNKTHRFAGKIWVVGSPAILCTMFLPMDAMIVTSMALMFAMILSPILYSYIIYKKHQKEDVDYTAPERTKAERIATKVAGIVVVILLAVVGVVMFTGDVKVTCGEDTFQIEATYEDDFETSYEQIASVEYREEASVGARVNGFGSIRLSLGVFQNEEFGTYTLYAYTGADAYLVLRSVKGEVLMIGLKDADEAKTIYQTLLEKIAE
jgi:uncharacterized membrane protein